MLETLLCLSISRKSAGNQNNSQLLVGYGFNNSIAIGILRDYTRDFLGLIYNFKNEEIVLTL